MYPWNVYENSLHTWSKKLYRACYMTKYNEDRMK